MKVSKTTIRNYEIYDCAKWRSTIGETLMFRQQHGIKKRGLPMEVEEIHVDEYRCPACGAENTCGDISLIGDSYCPECGQAIYQQN